TATVQTPINHLRKTFPEGHFVGVEPPVKPLALSRVSTKVLLTTKATAESAHLLSLLERYSAQDIQVVAASGLADAIERDEDPTQLLSSLLQPFTNENDLAIGLGCTHFSF